MTQVPFSSRALLYGISLIPQLSFYFFTEIYKTNSEQLLILITCLQFLLPLLHDGMGTLVDNAYVAVMGMILGIGMTFYIQERRFLIRNNQPINQLKPFYYVISKWNNDYYEQKQRKTANKNNNSKDIKENNNNNKKNDDDDDIKPDSIQIMAKNSTFWLIKATFFMILTIPVMSFFDGILRSCQLPPNADTVSFWKQLPMPWLTLLQYFVVGFTLFLHVGIVDYIFRLLITIRLKALNIYYTLTTSSSSMKLFYDYYKETKHNLSQPFIFNHPWYSHSIYDLWSRRWVNDKEKNHFFHSLTFFFFTLSLL
ncbi:unnamed protein product [Cunninghamella blakesleeana]